MAYAACKLNGTSAFGAFHLISKLLHEQCLTPTNLPSLKLHSLRSAFQKQDPLTPYHSLDIHQSVAESCAINRMIVLVRNCKLISVAGTCRTSYMFRFKENSPQYLVKQLIQSTVELGYMYYCFISMGNISKIPPPLLLINKIVRCPINLLRIKKPLVSCNKAKSPVNITLL